VNLGVWSRVAWVTLPVVALIAVAAPEAAAAGRWVPLLAGLVLFVLPHGAVDHHVPRRLNRGSGRGFVAAYLVAVVGGLVLWAVAPLATLAAFLLVAALHWGTGDGWFARAANGRARFRGPLDVSLFVAARGALPVALPALAHPAELSRGVDAILGAVGGGPVPVLSDPARVAGLVIVAALVAAAAAAAVVTGRDRPRAVLVDVGELALLAAFFTVTPAILAVGTYLLAWHAPRHVARLIAADPVQAASPPVRALLEWTREAAPLTLASLAGLALLIATAWQVPAASESLAGAALALIAALTFPHAATVAWMDREQRVFASAPRPRAVPTGALSRGSSPAPGTALPTRSSVSCSRR